MATPATLYKHTRTMTIISRNEDYNFWDLQGLAFDYENDEIAYGTETAITGKAAAEGVWALSEMPCMFGMDDEGNKLEDV